MLEREIEAGLVRGVERKGGLCLKWVCPGTRGAPDRIVVLPGGRIWFVELKTPRGSLRPWQLRFHRRLEKVGGAGLTVAVLRSEDDVEDFLGHM